MDKLDPEVVKLCEAINGVSKYIQTTESCAGHGKEPLRIFFNCTRLDQLPKLLYWFSGCHSGEYGWVVSVKTDCSMSPVYFMIESPNKGQMAYKAADHIAACIEAQKYVED